MKKLKIIIITIIIFFSLKALSAGTSSVDVESSESINDSDQILILYQRAENYILEENYKKSLKVLKSLIKREDLGDHRANIYNLLGYSYRKISKPDLDKSYAAYMMALELDPSHIGAHEYLGELYLMLNEKNKAIEMLNKLEKLVSVIGYLPVGFYKKKFNTTPFTHFDGNKASMNPSANFYRVIFYNKSIK